MLALSRGFAEAVRAPRTLLLPWPLGHAFGEPGAREQQLWVLLAALDVLARSTEPGQIWEAPWRWRREHYPDPLAAGAPTVRADAPPPR